MENETEDKVPMRLRAYLDGRSEKCRSKILAYLESLKDLTTVSEIARATGTAKPTVVKTLTKCMAEGNPYRLGVKKVGKYEVIYKKTELVEDGSK